MSYVDADMNGRDEQPQDEVRPESEAAEDLEEGELTDDDEEHEEEVVEEETKEEDVEIDKENVEEEEVNKEEGNGDEDEDDERRARNLRRQIKALEQRMNSDEDEEEFDEYGMSVGRRRKKRKKRRRHSSSSRSPSRERDGFFDYYDDRMDEMEFKRRRMGYPNRPFRRKSDKICELFMQGKCPKSPDRCMFSHEAQPPRIMELCKFYLFERCAKREKCLYLHKDFPCKYFHTGKRCMDSAENCKFSHEPLDDQMRAILIKHLESAPKEILGDFPRMTHEAAVQAVYATEAKHKGWTEPKPADESNKEVANLTEEVSEPENQPEEDQAKDQVQDEALIERNENEEKREAPWQKPPSLSPPVRPAMQQDTPAMNPGPKLRPPIMRPDLRPNDYRPPMGENRPDDYRPATRDNRPDNYRPATRDNRPDDFRPLTRDNRPDDFRSLTRDNRPDLRPPMNTRPDLRPPMNTGPDLRPPMMNNRPELRPPMMNTRPELRPQGGPGPGGVRLPMGFNRTPLTGSNAMPRPQPRAALLPTPSFGPGVPPMMSGSSMRHPPPRLPSQPPIPAQHLQHPDMMHSMEDLNQGYPVGNVNPVEEPPRNEGDRTPNDAWYSSDEEEKDARLGNKRVEKNTEKQMNNQESSSILPKELTNILSALKEESKRNIPDNGRTEEYQRLPKRDPRLSYNENASSSQPEKTESLVIPKHNDRRDPRLKVKLEREKEERMLNLDLGEVFGDLVIPDLVSAPEEIDSSLPFKRHQITPSVEIDASLSAQNAPVPYRLHALDVSKPNYKAVLRNTHLSKTAINADPRLNKFDEYNELGFKEKSTTSAMTASSSMKRDPRRRTDR